jgi:hypothetical protein
MSTGADRTTRGAPRGMLGVYRRRRAVAGLIVLAAIAMVVVALRGGGETNDAAGAGADGELVAELPGGGRELFPARRLVSFYGAPQDDALGALGVGTPAEAARRLREQAEPYSTEERPVLPALELIATIADAAPGAGSLYRTRQKDDVIRDYLRAARAEDALLVLDIQPGRSTFMREVRAFRHFLDEPDVGLALDPEWRMGSGEVPGETLGSVDAAEVNEVARYLSGIVERGGLPEKLLLVHQFTTGMIRNRQDLEAAPGVALTLNADGFGDPRLKRERYRRLIRLDTTRAGTGEAGTTLRFPVGLKLFYEEDSNLLSPAQVMRLSPPPDVVVYE